MILATSLHTHWSAYISMYYFQQVSSSFYCSEEWSFSHLAQKGTVRKHQMIHNQVISKIHLYGVSSCALHRCDTLISIIASLSSRHLLLLRLSLPLSDKVKQLHGDCIAYNKATTIWLLPVADSFVIKHGHLIQQFT